LVLPRFQLAVITTPPIFLAFDLFYRAGRDLATVH